MAWIESHQELARHPKTRKLARQLGVSVPCAIGHLQLLWWWAVDYAEDGWLRQYGPEDLADAMLWECEPRVLWDALVEARWVDVLAEGNKIHDWEQYAGRLLEQREARRQQNREAQSRRRQRTVSADSALNTQPTVPNHTEHNQIDAAAVAAPSRTHASGGDDGDIKNSFQPRERGEGGFQPIGLFMSGTQRRRPRQPSEIPEEVRQRLAQPPIGNHLDAAG